MANESSGKKALKAGLGYTVGNMLVKGLSFLAIPLFARLMTVEDFGIYSTFSSYVMIMTVLAGFTLHTSSLARLACRPVEEGDMLMHDWWLALIAAAMGRAVFLDRATIDYRQHGGNEVGAKDHRSDG